MAKSLIFLQAPLKMAAVLNCYDNEKSQGNSVVIVLPARLKSMLDFITCLHVDSEVFVLEDMVHRSLLNIPANKRSISRNKILINYLAGSNGRFFFTDLFDPDLALLLQAINHLNPTQIQTKVDIQVGSDYEKLQNDVSVYHKICAKLFSKIYHSTFVACKVGFYLFYTFDNRVHKLPAIDYSDTSIIERYRIKTINHSGKSVIFFSNPNDGFFCTDDEYGMVSVDVVRFLQKKGYFVAAKGHPREGSEKHVDAICDYVIPGYIPAEFIDLKQFDFAIGFFSTALCNASFVIKGYSLMKIPKISDRLQYERCMGFFDRCDNRVVFIGKFEDMLFK